MSEKAIEKVSLSASIARFREVVTLKIGLLPPAFGDTTAGFEDSL